MTRRLLAVHAALCLLAIAAAVGLGNDYRARLSTAGGFFQVAVAGGPPSALHQRPPRPRRTVVVVFDGLGHVDAERMGSLVKLGAAGQCRLMDVAPLSLSRPMYATLSTGIEVDRHGCRDNDCPVPLGTASLWQVARGAGLRVSAISELPWWGELFPDGFDDYRLGAREEDFLADGRAGDGDLQLIHPLYLDETAHDHGASSAEFQAALARADGELGRLLARVDLARDVVVVTADHGHTARGGHGGVQDRVARVLTCLAGPGVARREGRPPLLATALPPSLALLLDLPFPAGTRADREGDDGLDVLWEMADAAQLPRRYLDERRADVARFRDENAARVLDWDPASHGSWSGFYTRALAAQRLRALPAAAALLLVAVLLWRARERGPREQRGFLFGLLWIGGVLALGPLLQVLLRGSFDLSSVNTRAHFLRFTVVLSVSVSLVAAALHLALRRRPEALVRDSAALMAAGAILCLAHPLVYGYHVGFPLPSPPAYFFPFFATLYLTPMAVLGLLGCAAAAIARGCIVER